MRNQLLGILILGILALLGFGLMAGYLAESNPRVKLKILAEKQLPVVIDAVTEEPREGSGDGATPGGGGGPRAMRVRGRTRDGHAPSVELARAIARIGQEVVERKETQRARVDRWVIELEGLAPVEVTAVWLERADRLEEVLTAVRTGIVRDLGEGIEVRIVEEDGGRLGLAVGGVVPDKQPEDIARLLLGKTGYQFAFVRVGERVVEGADARKFRPPPKPTRPAPAPAPVPPAPG